ncbi:NADH-quinone oxidoreductase subunit L [Corynebacterium uterequi]|uniref:Proton-translocating NADH-quinone oxidoreductase, chain L n=1 Tax=Corynebacterium uterequi TaxID=1072256 RepID=A0A0G3HB91_9CORY|nr:NADH-quinone oxidoreductase subunit L [Corynebacterium uterequi]AKK10631.1 proton-translocating NADH-quinone oxidoreductase, chain L [Corynebacterium uterequi]
MSHTVLTTLVIALPLAGALILLVGGKATNAFGHLVGTAASLGSFGAGLALLVALLGIDDPADRVIFAPLYNWMTIPGLDTLAELRVDPLSICFVLLITGVGSLIHIYSIGYMAHDANRRKFFAYLNLFLASMLTLVLGSSFLILFVGWEGVGLCSYLLIGFWAHRDSAAKAGNKAFIMNRVGDVGMVLAIASMFAAFGSTDFDAVTEGIAQSDATLATLIGLLLLMGACAKSAQVPFQAWLLDAMEGPTPVSALIHAATMVTAGVYLIVRAGAVYEASDVASTAVVIIGTITLLAGAWIGCAKDDIKKVLAGSTMSQIGYMVLAAGIGPVAYPLAIFHLITHGFFKANMFLGAGSVMHATGDDVNMRHFGALRTAMPWTFATFAAGYLAIIGVPGFAGFFSKDAIIEAAFEHSLLTGAAALIGAAITAFYMTRLMMMTFTGAKRWQPGVHPHESPATMVIPLVILGAASVVGGAAMVPFITQWLNPAVGGEAHPLHFVHITPVALATLAAVALGVGAGWYFFRGDIAEQRPEPESLLGRIGDNNLYADAINHAGVVVPTQAAATAVSVVDDAAFADGVRGVADGFAGTARRFALAHNGLIRSYGSTLTFGVAALGVIALILATVA